MDRRRLLATTLRAIREDASLPRAERRRLAASVRFRPMFQGEVLGAIQAEAAAVDGLTDDDGGWLDDFDWDALFNLIRQLIDLFRRLFQLFS